MMRHVNYQIEQTREAATIYVAGELAQRDVPALVALCDSLSPTVRTLRLDLRAVGCVSTVPVPSCGPMNEALAGTYL